MTDKAKSEHDHDPDLAPGEQSEDGSGITRGAPSYAIGLVLAGLLTAASFAVANGWAFVWPPAIAGALITLAIAQIGVHLVFFLHITTGPDNTNNVLALAFGVLIVVLLVGGSVWIMNNLNHNMMPPGAMRQM